MALTPTLAGFAGQQSGKMASEELRRFLLQFWPDQPDQQPVLFGFYALRRTQLVKLMKDFDIDAGGATAAADLVRICEVAWMQGRFPKPPAPVDMETMLRQQTAAMAALQARLAELEAGKAAPVAAAPAPVEPVAAPRVTRYSNLSWDALRDLAKKNLPATFKLHGKKREQIEDALEIEGVELPEPTTSMTGD